MKLLSFLCASMALLVPGVAGAFAPVPQAMTCMLYFKSDVVFTGEVLSQDTVKPAPDDPGGWAYTLKVITPYRNAKAATLKVFSPNDSGKLVLTIGKQYLLFAYNQDGQLIIGDDGLSGDIKDEQQTLKDLDKTMARNPEDGGDIYGRVTKRVYGPTTGGLSNIAITVQGPVGNLRAVTDANGWFKVHVSAGSYSATAVAPGWRFQSSAQAWEDAGAFPVPDGGCAEIQFEATPAAGG